MLRLVKRGIVLLLIGLLLPVAAVGAAPVMLTADQLQPGMQGIAKTVIEGTRIDTFNIEVVGVLKDSSDNDGKIIARASGAVIDKTGGVLQGMSGSPVYIDGKLIGAVSGGWKEIDSRTCIITPIADMLNVWNMPDTKNKDKIKQVDLKAPLKPETEAPEKESANPAEESAAKKEQQDLATPLMVSGFSEAGLNMLTDKLKPFQMIPYSVGGAGGSTPPVTIEAGSSIAAELVRGDISMSAIGTVTAVEDGKVLAFGHPFLRKGNVNYFMSDAQIITTASGTNAGFKIGTPGNLVGRINQDRSAAIAGVLGQYPSVIPLQIKVEDVQLNKRKTYSMQIAYDEDLVSTLVTSMVYNAMDKTIDRLGEGTAAVSFEIMTNGSADGKIKRDNMFYSAQDVGQLAVSELFQALNLLYSNTMREVDVVSVKVNIKIDENRKTASVIEAVPDKPSVKAGETVNLKLKVQPYRGTEEILIVPYVVPKHQAAGTMMLEVRGGGLVSLAQLMMMQQGIDFSAEEDKTKPLEVMVKEFLETNKNNEIIISPSVLPEDPSTANVPKVPAKQARQPEKEENKPAKDAPGTAQTKHATGYIIDNITRTSIQIK